MNRVRWVVIVSLLSGCATLPEIDSSVPRSLSSSEQITPAEPDQASLRPQPLQLDAAAEHLVALALARSPSQAQAAARLSAAQAQAGIASANRWPTLNGNITQSKQRSRADTGAGINTANINATRNNQRERNFELTWLPDLFGVQRLRRRAALAEVDASSSELALARLGLIAAVRSEIINLRSAKQQRAITERLSRTLNEIEGMQLALLQAGINSGAELNQLRSEIRAREAELSATNIELQSVPLRLRTLGDLDLTEIQQVESATTPACQLAAPDALPLRWLRLRPDVQAGEAKLRASVAGAQSVERDWLPSLSISARDGHSANNGDAFNALARSTDRFVSAALLIPIFDAGRRKAEANAAQARAWQAAAEFKAVILQAAEDVETSAIRQREFAAALVSTKASSAAAEQYWQQIQARQKAGIVSRLTLAQSERETLERRLQLLDQQRQLCLAAIELNRALALSTGDELYAKP